MDSVAVRRLGVLETVFFYFPGYQLSRPKGVSAIGPIEVFHVTSHGHVYA